MTTWNPLLRDQFEWHWEHQLRPRLAGLSDEEYLWGAGRGFLECPPPRRRYDPHGCRCR